MELWDILDENAAKTGRIIERGTPLSQGDYHLIVDVWIADAQKGVLLSKRAPTASPEPNVWQPTCGCAVAGDDSLSAALREVREELGITLDAANGRMIKRFTAFGHAIIDVWLFVQDVDVNTIVLQPGETIDAMWARKAEVQRLIDDGCFLSGARMPYVREDLDAFFCWNDWTG